jgi:hypothetical protein
MHEIDRELAEAVVAPAEPCLKRGEDRGAHLGSRHFSA